MVVAVGMVVVDESVLWCSRVFLGVSGILVYWC